MIRRLELFGEDGYRRGVVAHLIEGKMVQHEALVCLAVEWDAIKRRLELDDSWAELRMGPILLAEGPPCSDSIAGLPTWNESPLTLRLVGL